MVFVMTAVGLELAAAAFANTGRCPGAIASFAAVFFFVEATRLIP
jgi:hypothetical protein